MSIFYVNFLFYKNLNTYLPDKNIQKEKENKQHLDTILLFILYLTKV